MTDKGWTRMPLGRWSLPTNEPLADVLDPDKDTDGAPVHGEIMDGIQVVSGECLVCGEGWKEEREPGAKNGVSMWQLQGESEGRGWCTLQGGR